MIGTDDADHQGEQEEVVQEAAPLAVQVAGTAHEAYPLLEPSEDPLADVLPRRLRQGILVEVSAEEVRRDRVDGEVDAHPRADLAVGAVGTSVGDGHQGVATSAAHEPGVLVGSAGPHVVGTCRGPGRCLEG